MALLLLGTALAALERRGTFQILQKTESSVIHFKEKEKRASIGAQILRSNFF